MRNAIVALICLNACVTAAASGISMKSPSGQVCVEMADSSTMQLRYGDTAVLDIASFGVCREGTDSVRWYPGRLMSTTPVSSDYTMLSGKRRHCRNSGNEYRFECMGDPCRRIVMRVYDDGVAFRYEIDNLDGHGAVGELTSYRIPDGTRRWLQDYRRDYENFYTASDSWSDIAGRYGYPVLVQPSDSVWALVSESNISRGHAASSLTTDGHNNGIYHVTTDGADLRSDGAWTSPWRVIIVGSPAAVVESTLVTDVADQPSSDAYGWVRPGVASWVYWAYNHGSKDFGIVKQYIDMAAELGLPYVLIDWEWDIMGNGGDVRDAVAYARVRGVRPLLWYNSCTAWKGEGAPGPLYRLNEAGSRENEFAWLEALGVAGVKIDFFEGDTPSTMAYCIDLLESAARHHLLVNFHGATLPRGWQRTYPNFMSAEAVYGAEWYNNGPALTGAAASHNATLPFTRNVVGSMDYTPCTFSDSQNPHITGDGHELALTVVFESALQHLADKPESYMSQPGCVREFLGSLPSAWDDTRLLGGDPGRYAAIARRSGSRWYVGIINGTDEPMGIAPDWSRITTEKPVRITAIEGDRGLRAVNFTTLPAEVKLSPRGGCVFVIE